MKKIGMLLVMFCPLVSLAEDKPTWSLLKQSLLMRKDIVGVETDQWVKNKKTADLQLCGLYAREIFEIETSINQGKDVEEKCQRVEVRANLRVAAGSENYQKITFAANDVALLCETRPYGDQLRVRLFHHCQNAVVRKSAQEWEQFHCEEIIARNTPLEDVVEPTKYPDISTVRCEMSTPTNERSTAP